MNIEKSCGAIVFTRAGKDFRYVIVREKSGFHSFPKGHTEGAETDHETAIREIREETGLRVSFIDGFRLTDRHTMREKPGVLKQLVYFLAEYAGQTPRIQETDVLDLQVCTFNEAYHLLEFENSRRILTRANNWLMMTDRIRPATAGDSEEIMRLYRSELGRDFCPWTDAYPAPENIADDIADRRLFILRERNGRLIAAISHEDDPDVDILPCWDPALQPSAEFARLAVLPDMQDHGIARIMVSFMMDHLRRIGFRSVHFLVNRSNEKAIRSYAPFGCRVAGECEMYGQHFLCYEKQL